MPFKTNTYLLRQIDSDFWRRVKIQAAKQEKTVRDYVLTALAHYVEVTEKILKP